MFLRISHNYQSSYIFRTYLDIKEINVWNKWNLYINFIAHNWIHHWISCFLLFTKYRTPRLILNKFSTCFNKYSAHKMVYICFFFSFSCLVWLKVWSNLNSNGCTNPLSLLLVLIKWFKNRNRKVPTKQRTYCAEQLYVFFDIWISGQISYVRNFSP